MSKRHWLSPSDLAAGYDAFKVAAEMPPEILAMCHQETCRAFLSGQSFQDLKENISRRLASFRDDPDLEGDAA